MELEVLVEEANKHVVELQQRNTIWESICEEINALGKTKRTTNEIERRWQVHKKKKNKRKK